MSEGRNTIIPDNGERVVQQERNRMDADDSMRLYESELEALQEYDRVLTTTEMGREVVVEKLPDEPGMKFEEVDNE